MKTALELRPVSQTELRLGRVIRLSPDFDELEIGIRLGVTWGIHYVLFKLQELTQADLDLAATLHRAGLDSRNPRFGHGYLTLHTDRVLVPWTDWTKHDRLRAMNKEGQDEAQVYRFTSQTERRVRRLVFETSEYLKQLADSLAFKLNDLEPFQL